jgi:spore germination cell wall hydrolase CwlJ-like protein
MLKSISLNLRTFAAIVLISAGVSVASPTQNKIPEITFPKVDAKQLACMTKNIFFEAGGESIHGQAAVARVVLNRVAHGFANTPCNVVYQKTVQADKVICQFSWVCESKSEPNKNSQRYKVAQQVAYDVMISGMYKDVVPKSTLFFHNTSVDPSWPYKKVATIGGHVFYSKARVKQ